MQMQAREGQRVFSRQHGGGCKRPDSELFRITAASFCFCSSLFASIWTMWKVSGLDSRDLRCRAGDIY